MLRSGCYQQRLGAWRQRAWSRRGASSRWASAPLLAGVDKGTDDLKAAPARSCCLGSDAEGKHQTCCVQLGRTLAFTVLPSHRKRSYLLTFVVLWDYAGRHVRVFAVGRDLLPAEAAGLNLEGIELPSNPQ